MPSMTSMSLRPIWEKISMLRLEGVDVFYSDLQALWDVSFHVEKKEMVALIGSNGAGKTSTLKAISGVIRPRKGQILFEDVRLDLLRKHEIVETGVSMVPEGRRLFPDMSVLENLEIGAFIERARNNRLSSLGRVFEIFPVLRERAKQMAGTLSGGEQQMLAVARGLMSQPRLLLLDELSLGLAPLIVRTLYRVILDINDTQGLTILLVEQNVRYALETANRAYIIENGRVVGQGGARELLNSEDVKSAYLAIG